MHTSGGLAHHRPGHVGPKVFAPHRATGSPLNSWAILRGHTPTAAPHVGRVRRNADCFGKGRYAASSQRSLFDDVGVCQDDLSSGFALSLVSINNLFARANTKHREILQKLATNGSCANHEDFAVSELLNHIATQDDSQAIRTMVLFLSIDSLQVLFKRSLVLL